jgi:hypothetical protein
MKGLAKALLITLTLGASPRIAAGWTIGTALTDPCHERMTMAAAHDLITQGRLLPPPKELPENDSWLGLYRAFDKRLGLEFANDAARWQATSLLVGLRYPDIGDQSAANANALQQRHENPEYPSSHFIRGPEHDYASGDLAAYYAGLAHLRQGIHTAWRALEDKDPIRPTRVFLDDYGPTELMLWGPAFYLGMALHAFEDSFSHCVRSDDLRRIRHVMNGVEAGKYEFDPERDGLPHSSGMDACNGPGAPIAQIVPQAVADLLEAVAQVDDEDALNVALDRWLSYEPGCELHNDFCNSRWLEMTQSEISKPPFSCELTKAIESRPSLLGIVLGLLFQ